MLRFTETLLSDHFSVRTARSRRSEVQEVQEVQEERGPGGAADTPHSTARLETPL